MRGNSDGAVALVVCLPDDAILLVDEFTQVTLAISQARNSTATAKLEDESSFGLPRLVASPVYTGPCVPARSGTNPQQRFCLPRPETMVVDVPD